MKYNSEIHHRRSIRLPNYNQIGAYFITICTKEKQCLFGQIIAQEMKINHLGYIAFICWQSIPEHFSNIELDEFVIMPNHLHGILFIIENNEHSLENEQSMVKYLLVQLVL